MLDTAINVALGAGWFMASAVAAMGLTSWIDRMVSRFVQEGF